MNVYKSQQIKHKMQPEDLPDFDSMSVLELAEFAADNRIYFDNGEDTKSKMIKTIITEYAYIKRLEMIRAGEKRAEEYIKMTQDENHKKIQALRKKNVKKLESLTSQREQLESILADYEQMHAAGLGEVKDYQYIIECYKELVPLVKRITEMENLTGWSVE